ncbi:DUF4262 domain-containing protein [Brevundimonas sp. 2R-24]|uniref:DUF4262 domain-containing protein n=1 Tax=Peiella sedimenti TaxID=3061083 RepID=A0ABT8SHH6_9CAUL|nr:DUF4262 domain-containing protein [Caulobacteraceae bacterium XZ-24]
MAKTDAFDQNILDAVEEHGWFCMSVFDPEDVAPRFSYSIGFTKSLGQPEFIIFGLPADVAHGVLWNVFRALKDGRSPEDLEPWPDLIENYDCVARRVHPSQVRREYLNSALWSGATPRREVGRCRSCSWSGLTAMAAFRGRPAATRGPATINRRCTFRAGIDRASAATAH